MKNIADYGQDIIKHRCNVLCIISIFNREEKKKGNNPLSFETSSIINAHLHSAIIPSDINSTTWVIAET